MVVGTCYMNGSAKIGKYLSVCGPVHTGCIVACARDRHMCEQKPIHVRKDPKISLVVQNHMKRTKVRFSSQDFGSLGTQVI